MGVLYKSQNYATRSGVYASIFIPIDLRLFLYLKVLRIVTTCVHYFIH